MSDCEIREVGPADEGAWQAFAAAHPEADIYLEPCWRGFLQRVVGGTPRYLGAWSEGRLVGLLPTFVAEAAPGRVLNALPWYGSHGGCVVEDGRDDARRALLEGYRRLLEEVDPLCATLVLPRHEEPHRALYVEALRPRVTDHRVGQVSVLPSGAEDPGEAVLAMMRQKHRNQARKGLKQGFGVRVRDDDEAWRFLLSAHESHLTAIGGRAKPWSDFEAMREALPPDRRALYVAEADGGLVAALLLLWAGRTVEYLVPVVAVEWRSRQPLSALIHTAMVDALAAGRDRWNWGGTWESQGSLYHFKRGWGAEDEPYTYLVHARDDALETLRRAPASLTTAFRGYYLYPFDEL